MIKLTISQANVQDIDDVTPLFDAYRQFYEQQSNVRLAHGCLTERLTNDNCIVFLARGAEGTALAFTLLYPTFCSVAAQKAWILYDSFVRAQMLLPTP